jgi:DNA-binding NtrC family response regulator
VGGVRKVEVNVRIVAATNRNLDSVINNGSFRADLLYRINSFEIHLSPLRERPEDINPLAQYILKQLAGANAPEVAPEVMDKLREYNWPGNVRQLRNCLERAVLLANDGRVTINELPPEVSGHVNGGAPMPAMIGLAAPEGGAQPTALRDIEKQQIIAALEQTGWHRGKTAALLGISPSTLYRRLRDYNLEGRLK